MEIAEPRHEPDESYDDDERAWWWSPRAQNHRTSEASLASDTWIPPRGPGKGRQCRNLQL
jgi:hypothetical protein